MDAGELNLSELSKPYRSVRDLEELSGVTSIFISPLGLGELQTRRKERYDLMSDEYVRGPFCCEGDIPGPRYAEFEFKRLLRSLKADGAVRVSVIHRVAARKMEESLIAPEEDSQNSFDELGLVLENEYACQGIPVKEINHVNREG